MAGKKPEEIGTRITLLGVRYLENRELIRGKMNEIITNAKKHIKASPEVPKQFIIEPLSAYDYGP